MLNLTDNRSGRFYNRSKISIGANATLNINNYFSNGSRRAKIDNLGTIVFGTNRRARFSNHAEFDNKGIINFGTNQRTKFFNSGVFIDRTNKNFEENNQFDTTRGTIINTSRNLFQGNRELTSISITNSNGVFISRQLPRGIFTNPDTAVNEASINGDLLVTKGFNVNLNRLNTPILVASEGITGRWNLIDETSLGLELIYLPNEEMPTQVILRKAVTSSSKQLITIAKNENTPTEISMLSNPIKGIINLQGLLSGKTQINIFNIIGKLVKTVTMNINSDPTHVDISDLSSGIYILKATTNDQTFVEKFIKI